ncbi:exported hypothetical protein [Syntrophobacter sp. SbD1]|nr:exported hypothetical protein [Syntrophobacter sp. SbD1]
MERTGGKRKWRGIASFVIMLAFIFSLAWQSSASADQTLAEKLLDIMRANHQITEQQYKELKKQAEDEKAAQSAGAAKAAADAQAAAAAQAAIAAQAAAKQVKSSQAGQDRTGCGEQVPVRYARYGHSCR